MLIDLRAFGRRLGQWPQNELVWPPSMAPLSCVLWCAQCVHTPGTCQLNTSLQRTRLRPIKGDSKTDIARESAWNIEARLYQNSLDTANNGRY